MSFQEVTNSKISLNICAKKKAFLPLLILIQALWSKTDILTFYSQHLFLNQTLNILSETTLRLFINEAIWLKLGDL